MVTEEDLYIGDLPSATIDGAADFLPFGDTSDGKKAKRILVNSLPISTATQTALDAKEDLIEEGTTSQYFRGDKTFQTLNKAAVGLSNVDNTADSAKPVSTLQAAADLAAENNAKAYADTLVVGLLDDRGNYDASGNVFPSSGGSGTAGAIKKGDLWTISVAGTLGGVAVTVGDVLRALTDTPSQTASNWNITENNLGYVPENASNKSTNVDTDQASNTKYPSVKAVYDWATGLLANKIDTVNSAGAGETLKSAQSGSTLTLKSLVAGTNISFSVNGDTITIAASGGGATPSGVAGSIQFSNGSAFASDNANLFYDDSTNRVGFGVNSSLLGRLHIKGEGSTSATKSVVVQNSTDAAGVQAFWIKDNGDVGNSPSSGMNWTLNNNGLSIQGAGSSKTVLFAGASGNAGLGTESSHAFSFFTANNIRGQVSSSGQWLLGAYSTSYTASALLEVRSTTQGFLPPKPTTSQKTSIASPTAGLMVYDTTLNKLCVYNGTAWETVTSS